MATADEYLLLYNELISKNESPQLLEFEKKYQYNIPLDWFYPLVLQTNVVIKKSALNCSHGRYLYTLLSHYISCYSSQDITILETGTARGFSSVCMAKALKDQNTNGRILSIDCIAHNSPIYWNCIADKYGPMSRYQLLAQWRDLCNSIIYLTGWTNDVLNSLSLNRINFAFLDAQHDFDSILVEFDFVSKRQISGDIVFFDDVTESAFPGVCDAVRYINSLGSYTVTYLDSDPSRGYAIAIKN